MESYQNYLLGMGRETLQLVISSKVTDMVEAETMGEEANMKNDMVGTRRIGT